MLKTVSSFFVVLCLVIAAGVACAADAKGDVRAGIAFENNAIVLNPTTQCINVAEAKEILSPEVGNERIQVADVTCSGFWCGYGDDRVCCHSDYRYCCRITNSNSYYCSFTSCDR